jgi:hypothetical protein
MGLRLLCPGPDDGACPRAFTTSLTVDLVYDLMFDISRKKGGVEWIFLSAWVGYTWATDSSELKK